MLPACPALNSGEPLIPSLAVRGASTPSVAVLLTRLFFTQYCSTPAAFAGLIDFISGSAEISDGADNCADAAEQAHPSTATASTDLSSLVIWTVLPKATANRTSRS